MTVGLVISINEEFSEWLEDIAEKYNMSAHQRRRVADIIKGVY